MAKVYPDFIFAMTREDGKDRLVILESKGEHLAGNLDTTYKNKLLEICTDAFRLEKVQTFGQMEVVGREEGSVTCALVYETNWKADLASLLAKQLA
jgi:type III restriction enzyme